ncbi:MULTISPECIES: acyl carrier protein [Gluconobacter]|uniref:Acyl carrier protein n=6 Tax=Gluconobacter TaxID=441 RepID=Q5FPA3_GLUOX|nr:MULTISPECIES: acyl carrier protein [Gluconobacter]AAW61793.1 Acyl carrier protein [Gluconobacter oxydans 621H]AHK72040.1 putative acyl carrier protein [Gluconobacter oxydans DSM 3504]KXV00450.1 acyl carrier protein [Gluconobacter potus]KXV09345.1 acyl carrier protein [Gluconobacter oxydans]KXV11936.1 acyl carrier protein [Gluconobacter oxydans]
MTDSVAGISGMIIEKLLANPKVPRDIDGNSKIVEDLAFDSLAVMNFVMEIEDELDVSVPLDKLADIRTINDLAGCLHTLKVAHA